MVRRAEVSFWILTTVTTLAAGVVAQILTATAGPATHLELAASLLLLAVSATLLVRVLRYLTGATGDTQRRRSHPVLLDEQQRQRIHRRVHGGIDPDQGSGPSTDAVVTSAIDRLAKGDRPLRQRRHRQRGVLAKCRAAVLGGCRTVP